MSEISIWSQQLQEDYEARIFQAKVNLARLMTEKLTERQIKALEDNAKRLKHR